MKTISKSNIEDIIERFKKNIENTQKQIKILEKEEDDFTKEYFIGQQVAYTIVIKTLENLINKKGN